MYNYYTHLTYQVTSRADNSDSLCNRAGSYQSILVKYVVVVVFRLLFKCLEQIAMGTLQAGRQSVSQSTIGTFTIITNDFRLPEFPH